MKETQSFPAKEGGQRGRGEEAGQRGSGRRCRKGRRRGFQASNRCPALTGESMVGGSLSGGDQWPYRVALDVRNGSFGSWKGQPSQEVHLSHTPWVAIAPLGTASCNLVLGCVVGRRERCLRLTTLPPTHPLATSRKESETEIR